eukprot:scaffold323191_cov89-Cyclotella_meneghiniana.AAC.1
MQSLRPVHEPWFEFDLVDGDGFSWTPPRTDRYTGVSGGADWGPTKIALRTTNYAYKDWGVPTARLDRDVNTTKRPIMSAIFPRRGESLPGHRCLVTKHKKRYQVTEHFVLAWLGAVMSAGAFFNFNGDNNRGINANYSNASYGVPVPYIQNTMPQKAFFFLHNYIHFSRTQEQKSTGQHGYDPLFKSMIRYMGRAIAFIQYMPRKPIKHGIKVFAVCCSYTGVLLGFEVYCGSSAVDGTDNSAVPVVDSMALAHHLYNKYGYSFCGTRFQQTKRLVKTRTYHFSSCPTVLKTKYHMAGFKRLALNSRQIPAKPFMSIAHHLEGSGQQGRTTFAAPNAQRDYARHFNAVDRNDRDSADYTTSLRTNRWYLRVFFWLLDRVVHQLYVIIIYCARNDIGPTEWTDYLRKHGRRKFQIDLGWDLMSYAIRNSWTNMDGDNKPNWMRQTAPPPCECDKYFFCLNSLTTGLDHKRQKRTVTHFAQHDRARTKTVDCTDKRVDLQIVVSNYCKQCYRERPGTRAEKLDGIKYSRMGCPSCGERICSECWCWAKGLRYAPEEALLILMVL